jgi:hypothetical protein
MPECLIQCEYRFKYRALALEAIYVSVKVELHISVRNALQGGVEQGMKEFGSLE